MEVAGSFERFHEFVCRHLASRDGGRSRPSPGTDADPCTRAQVGSSCSDEPYGVPRRAVSPPDSKSSVRVSTSPQIDRRAFEFDRLRTRQLVGLPLRPRSPATGRDRCRSRWTSCAAPASSSADAHGGSSGSRSPRASIAAPRRLAGGGAPPRRQPERDWTESSRSSPAVTALRGPAGSRGAPDGGGGKPTAGRSRSVRGRVARSARASSPGRGGRVGPRRGGRRRRDRRHASVSSSSYRSGVAARSGGQGSEPQCLEVIGDAIVIVGSIGTPWGEHVGRRSSLRTRRGE